MRLTFCVQGALTAKPYAFVARPWELVSYRLVDPFEGGGGRLRVDWRGGRLLRVLPDPTTQEEWITDRSRFAFDGFRYQRLSTPLLKQGGAWRPLTWTAAWQQVAVWLRAAAPLLVLGPHLDPRGVLTAQRLAARWGLRPAARPADWPVWGSSAALEKVDLLLLAAAPFRLHLPLLHWRLRRLALRGVRVVGWATPAVDFPFLSLGAAYRTLWQWASGRHPAAVLWLAASSPGLLSSHPLPVAITGLLAVLQRRGGAEWWAVPASPTALLTAAIGGATAYQPPFSSSPLLWLVGEERVVPAAAVVATVYQGAHGEGAAVADLLLPTSASVEEGSPRLDFWGRLQPTDSLPPPFPLVPTAAQVLMALGVVGGRGWLPPVSWLPAACWWSSTAFSPTGGAWPQPLRGGAVTHYLPPANPYRLEAVSRASRPMALAARRLPAAASNYF